jgi:hypothetical protein
MNITNDVSYLDTHMPVTRLEDAGIITPINCSVCLIDIQLSQLVSKTPCEHYFH